MTRSSHGRQQPRGLTAYIKCRSISLSRRAKRALMEFDQASREEKMGSIERRKLMKAAAVGGIAFSIGGAKGLLAPDGARAQGAAPYAAGWPNRRLLDLLKIDHP